MQPPPGPPGAGRRKTIPGFKTAIIVAVLAIIVGAVLSVHLNYDVFVPGEAPSAEARVTINAPTAGTPECTGTICVHRRAGSIHLTTVGVYYGVRLPQLIAAKLNHRDAVYPESAYPNDAAAQVTEMDESQHDGIVAGLGEALGYGNLKLDGLLVVGLVTNTPANKVLQLGDVITAADGQDLTSSTGINQLGTIVSNHAVGESVHLSVLRGGKTLSFQVGVVKNPSPSSGSNPGPARVIGVEIEPDYVPPVSVKIDPGDIGGPSAGLSWAMSIVNLLGPDDLTRGRVIADTGTIDYAGNVGDIGGIQQKVYGAEGEHATIFVCPKDQAKDAQATVNQSHYTMRVIGVSTLHEAIQALTAS